MRIALAPIASGPRGQQAQLVAKFLTEAFGDIRPKDLGYHHAALINAWLTRYENPFTRYKRTAAARTILRTLTRKFGAQELAGEITKAVNPKPRNVTATATERQLIVANAPPHVRCWLLMCSDLAIRSGTAAKLGPANYDREAKLLTFRTKYQNTQQVPVTTELATLLDQCKDETLPFVAQLTRGHLGRGQRKELAPLGRAMSANKLGQAFARLRARIGITRKLTPHDLRRTTARNVYAQTRDLRLVQAVLGHSDLASTLWYLQDNLTEIPVTALELAKVPPLTERKQ